MRKFFDKIELAFFQNYFYFLNLVFSVFLMFFGEKKLGIKFFRKKNLRIKRFVTSNSSMTGRKRVTGRQNTRGNKTRTVKNRAIPM